jgi:hypothetical protein
MSRDPLTSDYPWYTPYQFAGNKPILFVDKDGAEETLSGLFEQGYFGETAKKIYVGSVEGIQASLSKTWSFISSDMWKAQTWNNIADVTAGNINGNNNQLAYNAIQPKVNEFKNEVVKGDAYTRSKYFGEVGTNFLTGYFSSKGLGTFSNFASKVVKTPWRVSKQSLSVSAIKAAADVTQGKTLYRIGTKGVSAQGAEAQFWSLENPLLDPEGYAKKYNVPLENIQNADFMETATLKKDANFVTTEAGTAPGSANTGKGIEVVVDQGGTTNNVVTPIKKN